MSAAEAGASAARPLVVISLRAAVKAVLPAPNTRKSRRFMGGSSSVGRFVPRRLSAGRPARLAGGPSTGIRSPGGRCNARRRVWPAFCSSRGGPEALQPRALTGASAPPAAIRCLLRGALRRCECLPRAAWDHWNRLDHHDLRAPCGPAWRAEWVGRSGAGGPRKSGRPENVHVKADKKVDTAYALVTIGGVFPVNSVSLGSRSDPSWFIHDRGWDPSRQERHSQLRCCTAGQVRTRGLDVGGRESTGHERSWCSLGREAAQVPGGDICGGLFAGLGARQRWM